MTSAQIRQSYLDFFKSKQHTIVQSSSLMPDSPNLLFTNAGMNQFVPIFLGQKKCPYSPGRAADTQKCIRAGGKHNDLEDVGLDTYHHTFFEMLGNWSFGDYFKKEAISWAWELITEVWKFPKNRLYATVYSPDKSKNDPSEFDQEAWDIWAEKFRAAGLDPEVHIVHGNKKDNFWMMGETGPCGPCSELHVDLTPAGDTAGRLVNKGSASCMEIWNLVFMQFNANPDGTFSKLPAHGVDTGMGFERVTSIMQCTQNFKKFDGIISNYETDIFRPIFDVLEKQSGKKYDSTLPENGSTGDTEQEKIDVAFRVIADHIRTLSFAIADGIQPGNNDRNYVLRRILRRAVKYGRTLGFKEPFFYKLVDVLAATMGDIFLEIRTRQNHVKDVIRIEEEAFNRTLDRGIELFNEEVGQVSSASGSVVSGSARVSRADSGVSPESPGCSRYSKRLLPHFERPHGKYVITFTTRERANLSPEERALVLKSVVHLHLKQHYHLFAACVMPDHVHILIEPLVKNAGMGGAPEFFTLTELMHSIKSFTAHEINNLRNATGAVWEKEYFDRLIRSESDLAEKFSYILDNPWRAGLLKDDERYEWNWTPADILPSNAVRRDAEPDTRDACAPQSGAPQRNLSGDFAFKLYDTFGFPLDLTELLARERGLTVDTGGFEKLMDEQRARARAAQKREVIALSEIQTKEATQFSGYEETHTKAQVKEVVHLKDKTAVVLGQSVFYAEMGGQVGDTGIIGIGANTWRVTGTQKSGDTFLHFIENGDAPEVGAFVQVALDIPRRRAIERHHTVTHLLHWALHEIVSREISQKGSFVNDEKLTFDFNSGALTHQQIVEVEKLVNARILENTPVSWIDVPHAEVKGRADVMQFFGDKYGDLVRVVQIGGTPGKLDGYSMELCGGTHVRATGEIGLFRIVSENAIAAGVRRIEAVAGVAAYNLSRAENEKITFLARALAVPPSELMTRLEHVVEQVDAMEKKILGYRQKENSALAGELSAKAKISNGLRCVVGKVSVETPNTLKEITGEIIGQNQADVVVLGAVFGEKVSLVCQCSAAANKSGIQAGKVIAELCAALGGKGGGKPDFAMGGGSDAGALDGVLAAFAAKV